jgi:hypothetical protein
MSRLLSSGTNETDTISRKVLALSLYLPDSLSISDSLCLSLPLSHAINSQANFISFGQNMEEKFHQLFPSKEIETSGRQPLLSSSPPDSRHGCP